ncbi:MAG: hypothetical protein JWL83_444 [Actinomycetia bacterium]|nr:hypothetical protein [Actinomycetes bacterium]
MAVDLAVLVRDLQAETAELQRHLTPLVEAQWSSPTPAEGWAIRDQVSHLAFFDDAATLAATDPDRFRSERDAAVADVDGFTESIAQRSRALSVDALTSWFREARATMINALGSLDPKHRVPWYGPDMSIASAFTARVMETWAHGQDVIDALGGEHAPTAALRHVCEIGVRTLPNSYLTRGLAVPDVPVRVALVAPGGDVWTWGPEEAGDVVTGPAVDFCLVVTQRRHVDDTALVPTGTVAVEWMHIAQAFAGPAGRGREPGASHGR